MKVPTAEPITGLDIRLWGILPYVTIAIFVAGTIWRYRYDKFGWTTRSSELYESRLLRIGSPLFHFGLLVVIVGHVIGLLIPKSWTDAVGLSQEAYHLQALLLGEIAGFCTLVGVGILIYRRRTTGPVFMATTRNDKLHAFTAPIQYLFRPYIVYRPRTGGLATRPARRGWERTR
jgi:nitrate reductase gamma subunit